jgi:hypothetical protein
MIKFNTPPKKVTIRIALNKETTLSFKIITAASIKIVKVKLFMINHFFFTFNFIFDSSFDKITSFGFLNLRIAIYSSSELSSSGSYLVSISAKTTRSQFFIYLTDITSANKFYSLVTVS